MRKIKIMKDLLRPIVVLISVIIIGICSDGNLLNVFSRWTILALIAGAIAAWCLLRDLRTKETEPETPDEPENTRRIKDLLDRKLIEGISAFVTALDIFAIVMAVLVVMCCISIYHNASLGWTIAALIVGVFGVLRLLCDSLCDLWSSRTKETEPETPDEPEPETPDEPEEVEKFSAIDIEDCCDSTKENDDTFYVYGYYDKEKNWRCLNLIKGDREDVQRKVLDICSKFALYTKSTDEDRLNLLKMIDDGRDAKLIMRDIFEHSKAGKKSVSKNLAAYAALSAVFGCAEEAKE